jgi:predicted phage terminase large subunit-like protein
MFKPAWTIKLTSVSKTLQNLTEDDVVLLFPERITYKFLDKMRRTDKYVFRSQFMLDPHGVNEAVFPQQLLTSITTPYVPERLIYAMTWDIAYTVGEKSDYSVGAVAGFDLQNRVFVLDVLRDKLMPAALCDLIVESYVQHKPQIVVIENSNGAQNLEPHLRRIAETRGVSYLPLMFHKCDRQKGAKQLRVGALQPLMQEGRLFLSNQISCLSEVYDEFLKFGSNRHDDIVDAISLLFAADVAPTRIVKPDPKQVFLMESEHRSNALYRMLFPEETPVVKVSNEPEWDNPPVDIWH